METGSAGVDPGLARFKTKPYAHQLECLEKYGPRRYFALLAEQGTGKTWIILNNAADLWRAGECDALLVFAPNGVHTNWTLIEIPEHMPLDIRYIAAAYTAGKTKRKAQEMEALLRPREDNPLRILTMNWESLQHSNGLETARRFLETWRAPMVVCDESDDIKNPHALRTKNLMKLKRLAAWRRIMTGTPLNNAPIDFFSQYSFLDESILGTTSFYAFKAEYSVLIKEDHHLIKHIARKKARFPPEERAALSEDVRAFIALIVENRREELIVAADRVHLANESEEWERVKDAVDGVRELLSPKPSPKKSALLRIGERIDARIDVQLRRIRAATNPRRIPQIVARDKEGLPRYRNLDRLSRLIDPHSFRVRKKDCLDLPDKIYNTLFFDLTEAQRAIYDKARKELRLEFEQINTPFSKLVAATKLSQITSGYYMHPLSSTPVRIEGENPKLDLLLERVRANVAAGEKTIIWARYTPQIEEIAAALAAEEIETVLYYGAIKRAERVEAIERFERGTAMVFLGNQRAGGRGLTLVAASAVMYFSNSYSLRDRLQSEDRAHRIGQRRNVVYTNFVAKNTIDETVLKALRGKKSVANSVLKEYDNIF